jgi:DNA gyrase subunit B
MPRLVAEGHLYVAQPPLYMLTQKKQRRYVQTEGEMQAILNEVGLADARLEPANATDPSSFIEGPRLQALLEVVTGLDNGLRAFGRRNLPLRPFLARAHSETGLLPLYHVQGFAGTEDAWPYTAEELESHQQAHTSAPGGEAHLAMLEVAELHEVRTINKWLTRLRDEFNLRADVLLPIEVTGDDPPPRFILNRDGEEHPLLDLRSFVALIRHLGEKGMKITRFKGLGEMDAEQLWDTTMDPTKRTLLKVQLDDVAAANDLFTTLMGDDVEPRREFIEKHALEVKNLDV